jgi:hypothetical protein
MVDIMLEIMVKIKVEVEEDLKIGTEAIILESIV